MAQWESPELIADILAGRMAARRDPRWAGSGAVDPAEYERWSWRCCGMACLRSVLLARLGRAPGIVTLAREVTAAGGYVPRSDGGMDGLIYAPFVRYLDLRWGIRAVVAADLSMADLLGALGDGSWVMASVHPGIRRPTTKPPERGGHLVLVHGVIPSPTDPTSQAVVLHNPSGDRQENQSGAVIEVGDLSRFFAGRGVVIPRAAPGRPARDGPAIS